MGGFSSRKSNLHVTVQDRVDLGDPTIGGVALPPFDTGQRYLLLVAALRVQAAAPSQPRVSDAAAMDERLPAGRASPSAAGRSYSAMVDIDLLVEQLRKRGHTVDHVFSVPANAGGYELTVDGEVVNLAGAEAILGADEDRIPG